MRTQRLSARPTTPPLRRPGGWAIAVVSVLGLMAGGAAATAQPAEPVAGSQTLGAYDVTLSPGQAEVLRTEGYDITRTRAVDDGRVRLEVIMREDVATELRTQGISVRARPAGDGRGAGFAQAGMFRSYSGQGGLAEELTELAAAYPEIAQLESIGQSVQGQDILALRVTGDAPSTPQGSRPAVLYNSTQHAREWIAPEVTRRLLRMFLEGYGNDQELTGLVDTRELWFVLVANPDGYDYTFTAGNRLWRKNLADNDGDGRITAVDGVDLNRNWSWRWGYDNEGSSPDRQDSTFRGPAPSSEPETRALEAFVERTRPVFMVNYHSAAELILYGVGSQVATPSPDDVILAALAGDDDTPAIEGFDPDLSAELYTTNGETTEHLGATYGTLAFTPELTECTTVAPNPDDCESVFNFPDDEALIAAEFERNIDFAVDLARSAGDPFEPVGHLGNAIPDIIADVFDTAHSGTFEVRATVSRQIDAPVLQYSVNGGPTMTSAATEWDGGERYGGQFDTYYREVRATIEDAAPGDAVEIWWSGGGEESARFTATVAVEAADVLVIANEDYDGFNPPQPGVDAPRYADTYTRALLDAGYSSDVWDLDARGVPHDLGVLSHYDAVIWYSGQNRITQTEEDSKRGGGEALVDESMPALTASLRSYLNDGGKLLRTGESAGYFGVTAAQFGGLLFAGNGDVTSPCDDPDPFTCLLWSDDFHQYYLGAYRRVDERTATAVVGTGQPLQGLGLSLGQDVSPQDRAGEFTVTSDVLTVETFPQFRSAATAQYSAGSDEPAAAITTDDTVFLPFGLEAVATDRERTLLMARIIDALTGGVRPDSIEAVTATIDGDQIDVAFELAEGVTQDRTFLVRMYRSDELLTEVEVDGSPTTIAGPAPGTLVEIGVASVVERMEGQEVRSEPLFFSPDQPQGVTVLAQGADPIAGAVEVCRYLVPTYTRARRVLLARADTFADALAGSALAGPDACILFTPGGPDAALDPAVAAEIDRVLPDGGQVMLLGGVNAVSTGVEQALVTAGHRVQRFAGPTRFETAELVATRVLEENPGTRAMIAYGLNWPDALMGGAFAARAGIPVVLSDTAALHPAAQRLLRDGGIEQGTLLGGSDVLSDAVLQAVPDGGRVAGANRMGTAVAIARTLWPDYTEGEGAVLVNAEDEDAWILALAAAPLSAAAGEPQLGLRAQGVPAETQSALDGLSRVQVLGGLDLVPSDVVSHLRAVIEQR